MKGTIPWRSMNLGRVHSIGPSLLRLGKGECHELSDHRGGLGRRFGSSGTRLCDAKI
jgi:hypothetical protein